MKSAALETGDVYRATEIVRDEDVLSYSFQRDAEQAVSPLAIVLAVGVITSWARRSKMALTPGPKVEADRTRLGAGGADA